MKSYTEKERREHLNAWKNGSLSKAAYAKSAGIYPTTFYTWTRDKSGKVEQEFVEINKRVITKTTDDIIIEKGSITIRLPLLTGVKELQTIFMALGGIQ